MDSAAFLCSVMALWQDTPLDMGCYYTVTTTAWGIYKQNGDTPTKSYYGMKAFGEIVRYPERIRATSSSRDFTVLAGKDEKGCLAILISAFKTGKSKLTVELDKKRSPQTAKSMLSKHTQFTEIERN